MAISPSAVLYAIDRAVDVNPRLIRLCIEFQSSSRLLMPRTCGICTMLLVQCIYIHKITPENFKTRNGAVEHTGNVVFPPRQPPAIHQEPPP